MKTLFLLLILVSCNSPKQSASNESAKTVSTANEPQEQTDSFLTTMPDGEWVTDCQDNYSSSENWRLLVQDNTISIIHRSYSTRTCDAGTQVDTVFTEYNRTTFEHAYSNFSSRTLGNYSVCAISNPSLGLVANIDNMNCQLSWENIALEIYENNGTYELNDLIFQ